MDFIPVDPKMHRHPKTRRLAKLLNMKTFDVWPRIVLLWAEAYEFYPDGDVTELHDDDEELSRILQLRLPKAVHFFDAMIDTEWIDRDGEKLALHDWNQDGCGRMMRAKEKAKNRLKKHRGKKKQTEGETLPETLPETSRDTLQKQLTGQDKTIQNNTSGNETFHLPDSPRQPPAKEPTLENILAGPEKKFTRKQKAHALREHFIRRNKNPHDKARAIKNIEKLLKSSEAFHRLLAAIESYSDVCDRKSTEAQYRKTCPNFFGRDGTWGTYADGIPEELQGAGQAAGSSFGDPEAQVIADNFTKIYEWRAAGGIRNNFDQVVVAMGHPAAEVLLYLAGRGFLKQFSDLSTEDRKKRLASVLHDAVRDAKAEMEKKENG